MLVGLGSFLELLKSIPAIVGVLMELRQMWNQYLDAEERQKHMVELQAAIKEARQTRDTTQLTNLVNSIVTGQSLPTAK